MNKCAAVILVLPTEQVLANQPADRACHNLYQLTDLSYAVEPRKLVAASGGAQVRSAISLVSCPVVSPWLRPIRVTKAKA